MDNNKVQTVTVNSPLYVSMLEGFVASQLRQIDIGPTNMYFQHDLATAYTAGISIATVQRKLEIVIPPFRRHRSASSMKVLVFQRCILSIQELNQAIVEDITALFKDIRTGSRRVCNIPD